ncbi:MAG: ATP-dependent Clp protease ATP-binding subunit [Clostridiales bacterium]|nr:ATP-dependent Clp protease ATP-binding subunit [Clostridiales bacterium]
MKMYPLTEVSENFRKALEKANMTAAELNTSFVGSEHFIYAFLCIPECSAYGILTGEGVMKDEYGLLFSRTVDKNFQGQGLTLRTTQMYNKSVEAARAIGMLATTAHMLYEILNTPECLGVSFLRKFADIEELKRKTAVTITGLRNRQMLEGGTPSVWPQTPQNDPLKNTYNAQNSEPSPWYQPPVSQSQNTQSSFNPLEFKQQNKASKTISASAAEKLLSYGIDMTERARRGKIDPVIGRKKEIEKVVQVLSRRSKNNPVLVGEPGVGKSAILEGLSQLIVDGNVPEQLYNKTIFSVDLPGLLAGSKYRGEFEEKLKNLIEAVLKDGDIVLFIDEIHTIVGAGGSAEGSMDAANILKPMLARGDLQVIGATTVEEYRKYIEKDSALERRFTPVHVEEPSEADAITILKGLRPKYEEHHGIAITDEAIEAAVKLSSRYITDRFLPDKAIDLIDEAAARVRIVEEGGSAELREAKEEAEKLAREQQLYESKGEYAKASEALKERQRAVEKVNALIQSQSPLRMPDGRLGIGREHVAAIISARAKIPLMKITQEEGEKLMRLEKDLHKRIIGQNEAVCAVSKAIRRARAGLKDPSRPIGSFIFVGPTGVGKTDLCKALAESMFGSEEQMIRLDMSEYMEKQSISKLIGAPPGYVGYDDTQSGQLTEKVRSKPYCVILFDEIEKAHPDVFNLLLQILDDGRLTDSKGRTVSFKNAVIILTSNVGAAVAQSERTGVYGFGGNGGKDDRADQNQYDDMKENITKALKEKFKPEFLNRMDDTIVFHRLSEADCAKIGGKIVQGLAKRLLEQRGIVLNVTDAALNGLVKEGYDAQYGARPLKRVIQKRIEDRLSEEILLGRVRNGQQVTVDFYGGEFIFSTQGGYPQS